MPESNTLGPEKPVASKKKFMLDLDALIPEKVPVQTSLGTLYAAAKEFPRSALKADQEEEVGRKVVQHTCGRVEDKNDTTPLSDEDVAALSAEDIAKLGPVIAMQQRWPEEDKPDNLANIGLAAKRALERESNLVQAEFKKTQDSLESSFGFLNQQTLRKLENEMSALSAFKKLTESASASSMLGSVVEEAIKMAGLDKVRATTPLPDPLKRQLDGRRSPLEPRINLPHIPRPEDSPVGRAALKSAENSEHAVELMRELTQHMAGVQETLVREVLPQWIAQVEREQEEAKADSAEAARNTANAAASLRWAKWGIAASIAVSVLATGWQVQVAREIDTGNTEQMQRAERLLQEQLAAQRRALEQQRAESQQLLEVLRKSLEQRMQPLPAAPSKKRNHAG